MKVWLNGELVDSQRARVSVFDHGLTVGDGVFETLKVVGDVPFAMTRHIERLILSAELLGLTPPSADVVRNAMTEAVDANAAQLGDHGRLRVTFTSGEGPPGSDRGPGPRTLIAYAVAGSPWPATTSAVTVSWPRNERGPLTGVKSTSYAENAVALAQAQRQGASEALWVNTVGQLCEGAGSNVFLVRDGRVLTPALRSGCLAGVTRALVLEWFDVQEADLSPADLAEADEVFLTSSTRDVHPVTRLDGRALGPIQVGSQLASEFAKRAAQDLDP